jgi:riboflavin kinase/FMN adenylyltransferase
VTNIGTRPSVTGENGELRVEVHLLDFEGDLYGERIELEFLARLRSEERFESVEALKAQIARDVARGRELLAGGDAPRDAD